MLCKCFCCANMFEVIEIYALVCDWILIGFKLQCKFKQKSIVELNWFCGKYEAGGITDEGIITVVTFCRYEFLGLQICSKHFVKEIV